MSTNNGQFLWTANGVGCLLLSSIDNLDVGSCLLKTINSSTANAASCHRLSDSIGTRYCFSVEKILLIKGCQLSTVENTSVQRPSILSLYYSWTILTHWVMPVSTIRTMVCGQSPRWRDPDYDVISQGVLRPRTYQYVCTGTPHRNFIDFYLWVLRLSIALLCRLWRGGGGAAVVMVGLLGRGTLRIQAEIQHFLSVGEWYKPGSWGNALYRFTQRFEIF
jgi:hypothetical protein